MRISARADYALRACIELAAAGDLTPTSEAMAQAQAISPAFLQNILADLRRAGYVRAARGGGYRLTAPADQTLVADVLRAMDGPLVSVHGEDPTDVRYPGSAEPLAMLWIAIRAN